MLKQVVVALVGLAAASPAWAHHSFGAEYDSDKPITVTGVLTQIQWTNPHIYFFLDSKGKNGVVEHWKFEGYPPGVLNREVSATLRRGTLFLPEIGLA